MFYGDALGFLRENTDEDECLQVFNYSYNKDLQIEMEKGQWSYITQLTLINCKCFVDNKEKKQVLIDYQRMAEELKLWQYYRCGSPPNYINKLKLGKAYYTSDFYWEDKRGQAFSRIIPIALVNKNFAVAQEEVYKNIIYINRHPQVILTGLLLLRTVYLLMNDTMIEREELINKLKDYLIDLKLLELEQKIKGELKNTYKIKFEQEKVNYLIDLDRIKTIDDYKLDIPYSKDIFLLGLINFLKIYKNEEKVKAWKRDEKEVSTIKYALLALAKQTDKIETKQIKDISFIENMNEYLFRLREYEIGRTSFFNEDKEINLFKLERGMVIKHPILNNIKIKDKIQSEKHIELIVYSRSGEYRFLKAKN